MWLFRNKHNSRLKKWKLHRQQNLTWLIWMRIFKINNYLRNLNIDLRDCAIFLQLKQDRQTPGLRQNDVFRFLIFKCQIKCFLEKVLLIWANCLMLLYITIIAMQKTKFILNVVSGVIMKCRRLTHANYFPEKSLCYAGTWNQFKEQQFRMKQF